MKKILISLCLLLAFLELNAQYSTWSTAGYNLINQGGELQDGIQFQAGARRTFNKVVNNEFESNVGIYIGYFSHYNDGIIRNSTIGANFGISDEDQINFTVGAEYFWQQSEIVPSMTLELSPFDRFLWTESRKVELIFAGQVGSFLSTNTWFLCGKIGLKFNI